MYTSEILKSLFNKGIAGEPLLEDGVLLAKNSYLLADAGSTQSECNDLPDFNDQLDKTEKQAYGYRNDPLKSNLLDKPLSDITERNRTYDASRKETRAKSKELGTLCIDDFKRSIVLVRAGMRQEDAARNIAVKEAFEKQEKELQKIKKEINALHQSTLEIQSDFNDISRTTGTSMIVSDTQSKSFRS